MKKREEKKKNVVSFFSFFLPISKNKKEKDSLCIVRSFFHRLL